MSLTRRAAILGGGAVAAAGSSSAALPLVDFGKHKITRLIVGGNPISGNSHVSGQLDREMLDYFTAANSTKLLADCERAGINTWQSRGDRHILRLLREHRLGGGRLHWIGQTASELADIPRNIRDIGAAGAIGIYHHGTQTDRFWANGQIDKVQDLLKMMRDTGARSGLGTHLPEVIDYAESKGWDLDYYMTSVYNLSRSKEELARLGATGDHFIDSDREAMLERVRKTSRQCLIFKVYGATRKCSTQAQMRDALNLVCKYAKPNDAIIVGMFPKHSEQVSENCRLFREALQSLA